MHIKTLPFFKVTASVTAHQYDIHQRQNGDPSTRVQDKSVTL